MMARLFLADVPIHLTALGVAIAADEKNRCGTSPTASGRRGEIGAVRMAPVCAAIEHASLRIAPWMPPLRPTVLAGSWRPELEQAIL